MMIIDCHGHYTTEPKEFIDFRQRQIAAFKDKTPLPDPASLKLTDDQLRESVQPQLKFQRERGTDMSIFSPRAAGMGHHIGDANVSEQWSRLCNDTIARICGLFPDKF